MVQDDVGKPREVWIRRKIFHIAMGTFFVCCMLLNDTTKWFFLLLLAVGIILSMVQERKRLPLITWLLERYDKKADLIPGQGPVAFFSGALFAWFIFGGDIAIAAVIALSFGDPMAYVIGRSVTGPRLPWNKEKTVLGAVSFIVAPLVLISLIWGPLLSVVISVSAAIVESVPWQKTVLTDDNIMVPILSSIITWFLIDLLPSIS